MTCEEDYVSLRAGVGEMVTMKEIMEGRAQLKGCNHNSSRRDRVIGKNKAMTKNSGEKGMGGDDRGDSVHCNDNWDVALTTTRMTMDMVVLTAAKECRREENKNKSKITSPENTKKRQHERG